MMQNVSQLLRNINSTRDKSYLHNKYFNIVSKVSLISRLEINMFTISVDNIDVLVLNL